MITEMKRIATMKEREHGSAPRNRLTIKNEATIKPPANQGWFETNSAIASSADHPHQAKGWNLNAGDFLVKVAVMLYLG
jgi:hypothetical protein